MREKPEADGLLRGSTYAFLSPATSCASTRSAWNSHHPDPSEGVKESRGNIKNLRAKLPVLEEVAVGIVGSAVSPISRRFVWRLFNLKGEVVVL